MNIEWLKLRPFNGDIKNGFEELVCQLARAEDFPAKQKFVRLAAPDGGVEGYCVLDDHSEYAWQAKFFTSMGEAQWKQLDKSFKTAVEKHPALKRYFICTPLDRQDPRIRRQQWFMDRWNKKVAEWTSFASSLGKEIVIEYWGNSEIFERLARPANAGKLYYWFGREEFSDEWFDARLDESIRNLDKRYTPELNFDLPVAKVFEGLSRDKYFQIQFSDCLDSLLRAYHKAVAGINRIPEVQDFKKELVEKISLFQYFYTEIDFEEICRIDQAAGQSLLDAAIELIETLTTKLRELDIEKRQKGEKKAEDPFDNSNRWAINYLAKFETNILDMSRFLHGVAADLFNNPVLLITGEAGIGKSHLLADITRKRQGRKQFSILLLGQHFSSDEPWSQIKKLLHTNCGRDIFLAALNAKGESLGTRVLLMIDAINEGEGRRLWKDHLPGFITAIRRYPYLGLAFSVRSSYQELLVPPSLIEKENIVKITHQGFASLMYEASKLFFETYQIKQPAIPLLHPEFNNPLFLKLFCQGLFKKGLHEIPEGYGGISSVIGFYLDAINIKISESYNLPVNLGIVQKTIKAFAGKIASENASYISFDNAFVFITSLDFVRVITDKPQFFRDLISEGLVTQNLYWDVDGNDFDGLYISYERFADHLVCTYLLDNYLNKDDIKSCFSAGTRLAELIADERRTYLNAGIVEALSIQLPERAGFELFEIAERTGETLPIAKAFIKSIIWRRKETIRPRLVDYINKVVVNKHHLNNEFISTILLVASQPGHYFNSDFLHKNLMRISMSDRDGWWTPLIHYQFPGDDEDITPIRRMVDWAWTEDKREYISDESIRLLCQAMSWFLTSTNRTLRDSVTKALICLLQERIPVLLQLLTAFKEVNDPYILQRLYAIAYGCAARTTLTMELSVLANYIYKSVFSTERVVPDILLRDYARNIIEFSVTKGFLPGFPLEKIRPPYKSEFPPALPAIGSTKKYYLDYKAAGFMDHHWSQNAILDSMKTNIRGQMYGDFGRYVFESAFDDWKDVDADALSRLAVKWIFEKYGYDVEKHGLFDRQVKSNSSDRHYVLQERIGKKYQWLAFYELLACVSDNFPFYENHYSDDAKIRPYEGPWDPYVRDIDPTIVIRESPENRFEPFWWYHVRYNDWDVPIKEWIFKTVGLPDPLALISVVDPEGNEWLVLEILCSWTEPTEIGEDRWERPHKELWYQVRSYLTHSSDHPLITGWAKQQHFMGRWMPEAHSRYEVFSREYYWSPACASFRNDGYREYAWSELFDRNGHKHVGKVAVTTAHFLWEEQFDASKKSSLSMLKPSEPLFELLRKPSNGKTEGTLTDASGKIICCDPSLSSPSYSCLLVRKAELLAGLKAADLDIFWAVLGGKQMAGRTNDPADYPGELGISGVVYFENGKLIHAPRFRRQRPVK